jgi:hypothetical protein
MPEKQTVQKANADLNRGKAPSTAAGEFVHEEIEHVREGKHGARSTKQAIAIGLSKARRAGVPLPPPKKGKTSERTRKSAESAYEVGQGKRAPRAPSRRRGQSMERALKREGHAAASSAALSRQAKQAAQARRKRGTVGVAAKSRATPSRTKKPSGGTARATKPRRASGRTKTRRARTSSRATH